MNNENKNLTTPNDWIELENWDSKKIDAYYAWMRNILVSASSLLGLLIALHHDKLHNYCEKFSYQWAISLLGFGILIGSISLYGEVQMHVRKVKHRHEQLTELQNGIRRKETMSYVGISKFYVGCKIACYVSLFLAMFFLITYSVLSA